MYVYSSFIAPVSIYFYKFNATESVEIPYATDNVHRVNINAVVIVFVAKCGRVSYALVHSFALQHIERRRRRRRRQKNKQQTKWGEVKADD